MKSRHPLLTLLFCALFCITSSLCAQDFSRVDAHARAVPFPDNQNIKNLAQSLTGSFPTEKEKARAIFVWIAEHISYDVNTLEEMDELSGEKIAQRADPVEVLRRRKAVCGGYANLFTALCDSAGLAAFTVFGKVKNSSNRVLAMGHAWNVVRAEGEWGLVDATWGSGDLDTDEKKYRRNFKPRYFWSNPMYLRLDHLPYDPFFQLSKHPLRFDEFKKAEWDPEGIPAEADPMTGFEQVRDSLNRQYQLSESERNKQSAYRMLQFDPQNEEAYYQVAFMLANQAGERYNSFVVENNERIKKHLPPSINGCEKHLALLGQVETDMTLAQKMLLQIKSGTDLSIRSTQLRAMLTNRLAEVRDAMRMNKENLKILRGTKGRKN